MAEANLPKSKAGARLLALLVLTSCVAASGSSCIPRRLLAVSVYPCKDDGVYRPAPKLRGGAGSDDDGGVRQADGSRIPKLPPSPKPGYSKATGEPAAPPGSNN